MFKKISVLTIVLLYLVTASGFALNLHYCGSFVASVKINEPAKKCGPVKMKCCHDKHLEVKVKDAHKSQNTTFVAKLVNIDLPKVLFADFLVPLNEVKSEVRTDRGPPDPLNGTPVYLKNCTFRI